MGTHNALAVAIFIGMICAGIGLIAQLSWFHQHRYAISVIGGWRAILATYAAYVLVAGTYRWVSSLGKTESSVTVTMVIMAFGLLAFALILQYFVVKEVEKPPAHAKALTRS